MQWLDCPLTDPCQFDILRSMQFDRLTRREFFTLLGGGTAWPFAARAQQTGKLPIIGFLGRRNESWSSEQSMIYGPTASSKLSRRAK